MTDIRGVPLEQLGDAVQQGLAGYSAISGGAVEFDGDQAARLQPTPHKGYTAKSVSQVLFCGEPAGELVVIAFAPEDGTGAEGLFTWTGLGPSSAGTDDGPHQLRWSAPRHPANASLLPRDKSAIHSEAYLTLAAANTHFGPRDVIVPFAGNLTVFHAVEDTPGASKLAELGRIGQPIDDFNRRMMQVLRYGRQAYRGKTPAAMPTVTLTTGTEGALAGQTGGERFGDPHAVYNGWTNFVQVGGFLAVSHEAATGGNGLTMLQALRAAEPAIKSRASRL